MRCYRAAARGFIARIRRCAGPCRGSRCGRRPAGHIEICRQCGGPGIPGHRFGAVRQPGQPMTDDPALRSAGRVCIAIESGRRPFQQRHDLAQAGMIGQSNVFDDHRRTYLQFAAPDAPPPEATTQPGAQVISFARQGKSNFIIDNGFYQ